ncbi:MAG TPA: ATP synthase F0 subunit B [Nannocystis sp.]
MHVPAILLASAAAPVVDIDGTAFIQAGLFFLLMAILYPLLFKPWLATQQRREQAIAGTIAAASDLRARAEEEGRDYDRRIGEVRARAAAIRSEAVKAGEEERQRQLAEARAAASAENEALRERLAREAEEARATLATRVDELAHDIATKLLGRTV